MEGYGQETEHEGYVRFLVFRALNGPASPCLLRKKKVSHSCRLDVGSGEESGLHVRIFHQVLVGPDVPLDMETLLVSSHGNCERPPRLPLQCNGPGIDVQVSVSKQHVRKVQHHVVVQSGCSDT